MSGTGGVWQRADDQGQLTGLLLRDIARHLDAHEVMSLSGEWKPGGELIDHWRPRGKRARRIYEAGRAAAIYDVTCALREIALMNERGVNPADVVARWTPEEQR